MLDDIRWEFGSRRYLSLEQFVTEVSRVNESAWPHDKIVMNNPKVAFEYSALISSLDELLPCENLAHADAVLQPDPTADGLFSVDIRAEIMATNRTSFSAGELLWIAQPKIVCARGAPGDGPPPPGVYATGGSPPVCRV